MSEPTGLKDGSGIQDEQSECLSLSQGRECLVLAGCIQPRTLSNS
jgi:hypothetical protein